MSDMSHNHQKKIAVINDMSGFGRCSIAVELPVISAMKVQCCPLPTSIFSNHTGFESFFFDDYTSKMNDYIETYKKMNIDFDGICSGFLGSAKQIEIVKEFFKDFKTEKNFILVDPVMGDHGKLYPTYTREMQEKMRKLMPYAAIVTPNLTELCALIDEAYHETSNEQELKRMCEKLSQMGPKMIVVTGISIGHQILNFVYNHGKVEKIYAKRIGEDRSGTGDVISAVIAGSYLKEQNFLEAVKKSTDFASKCIQHSVDIDAHPHMGLCFEPLLKELGD